MSLLAVSAEPAATTALAAAAVPSAAAVPAATTTAATAAAVVQIAAQVIAAVGAPISVANWPLYLYEAVSLVYSLVQVHSAGNENALVAQVVDAVIQQSPLTLAEKTNLQGIVNVSCNAVIAAVLKANSTVDRWVVAESKTAWTKLREWAAACFKRCALCWCCAGDSAAAPPQLATPQPALVAPLLVAVPAADLIVVSASAASSPPCLPSLHPPPA